MNAKTKPATKSVKPVAKKAAPAKKAAVVMEDSQAALKAVLASQGPFIGNVPPKEDAKVVVKKAAPAKKAVAKTTEGPTKAELARAIYKRMKGKARKDVLLAFQTEAKLTVAGSATYYANLKRESEPG